MRPRHFFALGQRIEGSRLVVIGSDWDRHGRRGYLCRCDCGGEKVVPAAHLAGGLVVSCGCRLREINEAARGAWSGRRAA